MAAIGKTVTLGWQGKDYEVQVTMRLINRIEEDVNLLKLAMSLSGGDVPTSHVATVFAHLLKAGGAQVTPDDVWQAMFSENAVDIIQAATLALECVFPKVAPVKGAADGAKGKQLTATRGKKSTS